MRQVGDLAVACASGAAADRVGILDAEGLGQAGVGARMTNGFDQDLFLRWCRYYLETELYDRRKPGHWSPHEPDCWLPNGDGKPECNRFALELRNRLCLGLANSDENAAAGRLRTEGLQDVLRAAGNPFSEARHEAAVVAQTWAREQDFLRWR